MTNLLTVAQKTAQKVSFPKIKETDKITDIVRKFCNYYANITVMNFYLKKLEH